MTAPDADRRVQTVALAILGVVGLGYLLSATRSFTIPFAVAALLAVLLTPILDRLERWHVPRVAALLLLAIASFGAFAGIGALVYEALRSVADAAPRYSARAQEVADWVVARLALVLDVSAVEGGSTASLNERLARLLSSETFLRQVNQYVGSFVSFLGSLLLMLLFLMFFLAGRDAFAAKIYRVLEASEPTRDVDAVVRSVSSRIQSYLVVKTAVSLGTGVAFGGAAWLFGLDFPLVWGFLSFVLNYVPSLGPLVAVVPPILLAAFQFESVGHTLATAATLLTINFVSGNVVEPQLMGRRLDLNVVVVLLSLFVWGSVWGFVGMLLAVPLTSVLNIVLSHSSRFQVLSVLLSSGSGESPADT